MMIKNLYLALSESSKKMWYAHKELDTSLRLILKFVYRDLWVLKAKITAYKSNVIDMIS